eukprot:1069202-Amphidinium_carterae.1
MLSGRQAIVLCNSNTIFTAGSGLHFANTEGVLEECCEKLDVSSTGSMRLVSGDDIVPARTGVPDWPGIQACGEISEYQLVVLQS